MPRNEQEVEVASTWFRQLGGSSTSFANKASRPPLLTAQARRFRATGCCRGTALVRRGQRSRSRSSFWARGFRPVDGPRQGKDDGARHRVRSESGRVDWEAEREKNEKEERNDEKPEDDGEGGGLSQPQLGATSQTWTARGESPINFGSPPMPALRAPSDHGGCWESRSTPGNRLGVTPLCPSERETVEEGQTLVFSSLLCAASFALSDALRAKALFCCTEYCYVEQGMLLLLGTARRR
ncbi:hypothetical protein V8C44DRAFT_215624 [Trichoderma aethiopicum]